MVAFTPVVQVDFTGAAVGAAPTWTDITRFARLKTSPATVNKWRQDELSDAAPSQLSLQLDNEIVEGDPTAPNEGRFTPGLSTSPWYPNVTPGARIRIGVTISGTTYWRFDGYVDSWDAGYDDGDHPVCAVTASDILGWLGGGDPLRTIYLEEALVDAPAMLYPLTEPATASQAGNISTLTQPAAKVPGSVSLSAGDFTFGTSGGAGIGTDTTPLLVLNSTLTIAAVDDTRGLYLEASNASWPGSTGITLEAIVTLNATWVTALQRSGLRGVISQLLLGPQNAIIRDMLLEVQYNAGSVQLSEPVSLGAVGPDLNDGKQHHLAVTYSTTTITAYVDGVQVGTAASAAAGLSAMLATFRIGGNEGAVFRGTIGYAAVYPTALSGARIAAHAQAAATGFPGESTSTHVARLLTYRPNLGSTLDTGQGTVSLHQFAGENLQQALLETGKVEGGLLFADTATGRIVLLNRTRLRNPAVALTLDITAQQTDRDLRYRADRQALLNDVTFTRPGGAGQRVTDATSKSKGTRALNEQRIFGADADALAAAGWLVANGKTVRNRTPNLPVDLLGEPSATVAAGVLNLTPLQRVSLINPPASAPATDVIVQGCVDTIGVDVFACNFYTTPLPRPTLRFDATADSFTKLDAGNVFAW